MTENTVTRHIPAPPRIVVGVDFSRNAARAANWAARDANNRGLALHLAYAYDRPGAKGTIIAPPHYVQAHRMAGEKLLAKTADTIREQYPHIPLSSEVFELGAADALITLSRHAQLVVTGTRGHGGFTGMLLGSVSLTVAAHAHCPTVVIHGEATDRPLNEIVLGIAPGQAQAPIRFAFASAATLGAPLSVIRCRWPRSAPEGHDPPSPMLPDVQEEADIADLLRPVREDYPDVKVSTYLMRGNPVPSLIGAAQGSRLLVVGTHHHHGPLSIGTGYVIHGLLAHSLTPVAVVPPVIPIA
jgi:nucleotide-binding universal stress UspA family protein